MRKECKLASNGLAWMFVIAAFLCVFSPNAVTKNGSERTGFSHHALLSMGDTFGITCNARVRSSQSSLGPAGGTSHGYGLGRGPAGPDRRCTTTAAGALRVIVQDGFIHMSGHAPPPVPIGNGVTGGPESVRDGLEAEN